MKFFTVFAAVLAVAASAYSPVQEWTLAEIEAALQDPNTDPAQVPYLIEGLNTIVAHLYNGVQLDHVTLSMPVTVTMTLDELASAIHDPKTELAVMPYYEEALNELMVAMFNGQDQASITLTIPAMNVRMWTLNELSATLQSPDLEAEAAIYLENALNKMMEQLMAGNHVASIAVVTPPGVMIPVPVLAVPEVIINPEVIIEPVEVVQPEAVIPEAVFPVAVKPEVVAEPAPVAPVAPATAGPLVQLIVNVKATQQTQQPEAVIPSPIVTEITEDQPIIAVGPWA